MARQGRVLIVDDEPNMVETLGDMLAAVGHRVAGAFDGAQALEHLQQREFDVVLTDLKMPGMDGMQLLEMVKNDHSETDVILLTGYGTIQSAVAAMKIGAYDYLLKPLQPEEIVLAIDRLLEQRSLNAQGNDPKSLGLMPRLFLLGLLGAGLGFGAASVVLILSLVRSLAFPLLAALPIWIASWGPLLASLVDIKQWRRREWQRISSTA